MLCSASSKSSRVPPRSSLISPHFSSLSSSAAERERETSSMEFLWEIFLIVLFSIVSAIVIAALLIEDCRKDGAAKSESSRSEKARKVEESSAEVIQEERVLGDELRNLGLESERRVESVGEAARIDEFGGESDGGLKGFLGEVVGSDEEVIGEKDLVEEVREDVSGDRLDEQSRPMEEKFDDEEKPSESLSGVVSEEKFVDERKEGLELEIGLKLAKTDEVIDEVVDDRIAKKKDEHVDVVEASEEMSSEIWAKGIEIAEKEGLLGDDDDWEGIERSGIEKRFDAAARFVGSDDNSDRLSQIGSDLQMQLYALHKVAIEGPCYEPSPMALMVSARAKWNAWQKLGNMSPEVAMEQYISIISEGIPGWEGEKSDRDSDRDKRNASPEMGESGTQAHGNYPRIAKALSTCEGVDDAIEGVKNS